MTGRPFAGILLGLLAVGPLLADESKVESSRRDPLAGLDVSVWQWRRFSNQVAMLPLTRTLVDEPKVETPKLPEQPKLPDVAVFDKLVIDSLREVHNRGADLYNTSQNFEGTYRVYQGGLLAVSPLLAHRPSAQKLIEEGVAAADKELTPAKRAFKLHETIEAVRKSLKDANEPLIKPINPELDPKPKPKPKEPPIKPIPVEKAPTPHEKKTPVEEKKSVEEKKPAEKKPAEKKPAEEKKPKEPEPVGIRASNPDLGVKSAGPSGKVTLKGQPLTAAEVTVVSLDQKQPRVFTAVIQADGTYRFAEVLPPGRYVVIVTAKTVPEKYQLTTTSGVVIEVKAGAGAYDIELK